MQIFQSNSISCSKWAVIAPNSPYPTEAIRRFMYRNHHWCLVAFPSAKHYRTYQISHTTWIQNHDRFVKLSVDYDANWTDRKNLAYLFAIRNGASVIWDFDEDVNIDFWLEGAAPESELEIDSYVKNYKGLFSSKRKIQ